jgi:hypothetical protein
MDFSEIEEASFAWAEWCLGGIQRNDVCATDENRPSGSEEC